MEQTGAAMAGGCAAIAGRVGNVGSAADPLGRERPGGGGECGGGTGASLMGAARTQAPRL
jgi:hypothetical protein